MHKVILAMAATTLVAASFALAPAAYAGHDKIKIIERTDGTILVPGTYTTVESAPGTTILREESAVISTPVTTKTVIKEKRKRHHLLKLPFISVF
jgi:hypothetical protein